MKEWSNALSKDAVEDMAVDIGEAAFEAVVVVGEARVIKAEEVEDGGVSSKAVRLSREKVGLAFIAWVSGRVVSCWGGRAWVWA